MPLDDGSSGSSSSSSLESWPRWRQSLYKVPKDELCGSQRDLLRCMELLDTLSTVFDGKHPTPTPTAATPDAPFAVFLAFLEIYHLPIKDRSILILLPRALGHRIMQFLFLVGFGMENYLTANDTAPEPNLQEVVKPCSSPLARAIYKLVPAACFEILEKQDKPSLFMGDEALAAKNLLADAKNLVENEKEMKRLQEMYKTQLTLADLIEMSEFLSAVLIMKAAKDDLKDLTKTPNPQFAARGKASFENILQVLLDDSSLDGTSSSFWFRNSRIYHVFGNLFMDSKEEMDSINKYIKKIIKRNVAIAEKLSPPDPLREAWACFDYALTFGSSSGFNYKEVKGLLDRGHECLAACKAWVPPYFRKIIIEGGDLVEQLLVCAQRVYPNDYKTRKLGMEVLSALQDSEWESITLTDPSPVQQCSACGEESRAMSACSRCKKVYYCNAVCQKKHWKVHKRVCKSE